MAKLTVRARLHVAMSICQASDFFSSDWCAIGKFNSKNCSRHFIFFFLDILGYEFWVSTANLFYPNIWYGRKYVYAHISFFIGPMKTSRGKCFACLWPHFSSSFAVFITSVSVWYALTCLQYSHCALWLYYIYERIY